MPSRREIKAVKRAIQAAFPELSPVKGKPAPGAKTIPTQTHRPVKGAVEKDPNGSKT